MATYTFNKDFELIEQGEADFMLMNFETLKVYKVNETSFRILDHIRRSEFPVDFDNLKSFIAEKFENTENQKVESHLKSHIEKIKKLGFITES